MHNSQLEITVFDIETTPILGYTYGMFKVDVSWVVRPSYILMFACQKLGENKIYSYRLPDFPLYKRDKHDDYALVKKLRDIIDKTDILVGHNIRNFDLKKFRARCYYHGIKPPSDCKTYDTCTSGKEFGLERNSLKYWATYKSKHNPNYKNISEKGDSGGLERAIACMEGDMKAWKEMNEYCKQDVRVSERLYLEQRPYTKTHPFINEDRGACPVCASKNIIKRGIGVKLGGKIVKKLSCKDCGKNFQTK